MKLSEHPQFPLLLAISSNFITHVQNDQSDNFVKTGGYYPWSGVSPFWDLAGLTMEIKVTGGITPNWVMTLFFLLETPATDSHGNTGMGCTYRHDFLRAAAGTPGEWRIDV